MRTRKNNPGIYIHKVQASNPETNSKGISRFVKLDHNTGIEWRIQGNRFGSLEGKESRKKGFFSGRTIEFLLLILEKRNSDKNVLGP